MNLHLQLKSKELLEEDIKIIRATEGLNFQGEIIEFLEEYLAECEDLY